VALRSLAWRDCPFDMQNSHHDLVIMSESGANIQG
jgi:hypothetical protein